MFQLAIDVKLFLYELWVDREYHFVLIKTKYILFFSQNSDLLNNKMKYKNTPLSEQF
jgi:hypothetical protein